MHQALYFALLAGISVCIFHAFVNAEQCTVSADCGSTHCNSGFHVVCEHPPGAGVTTNGGLCTCAVDNLTCTARSDCLGLSYFNNCISEGHKHCYDNRCICTRW